MSNKNLLGLISTRLNWN